MTMETTSALAVLPQHLAALKRANEIRLAAAEAKREIVAGKLSIEEALQDPRLEREQLGRLLCAQARWGKTRARKLCARLNAGATIELKRVLELTPRQRRRVLALLEDPDLDFRVLDPFDRLR